MSVLWLKIRKVMLVNYSTTDSNEVEGAVVVDVLNE